MPSVDGNAGQMLLEIFPRVKTPNSKGVLESEGLSVALCEVKLCHVS